MTTLEQVKKILKENNGVDTSAVAESTTFEQIKLDSLDVVDLIMVLEEKFNISIEQNQSLKTVGDLVGFIDNIKK